jgi:ABC-2 type transport system permease protein
MSDNPRYGLVLATFARNSLVRDMTYRANFMIECITSLAWVLMNLGFYLLVFQYTSSIGPDSEGGWSKHQFFVFMATSMIINSVVQALFMPNAEEFGELIRTGGLDFALVKPIDTQFLVSLRRIEWSPLANLLLAGGLLSYALGKLGVMPTVWHFLLYPLYVLCGVAVLYSLMIAMAAVSVFLGRNQSLYDFWFYITNFSRYPKEIYHGRFGTPLQYFFTYLIPVLVVINVPARLLAKPFDGSQWDLALFAIVATAGSLLVSRWIFTRALARYRSASS